MVPFLCSENLGVGGMVVCCDVVKRMAARGSHASNSWEILVCESSPSIV